MSDLRYWQDRVFSSKYLGKYRRLKAKYNALANIDYHDRSKFNIRRDILQNDFKYGRSKERELSYIDDHLNRSREEVFKYLDSVGNPYEILFTEFVDEIDLGSKKIKVVRGATGFNDTSYDIARQYAMRGVNQIIKSY